MRSAYYSDLCSKFMIENTILKMEYAEVRVFSISDKVGSELKKKKKNSICLSQSYFWPSCHKWTFWKVFSRFLFF